MESLGMTADFWLDRSIIVTGHTGFKGGWLTLWLHHLGARVHGFALDPTTDPNFFEVASVGPLLASDTRTNLADLAAIKLALSAAQPEVIFHLAALGRVRCEYL